MSDPRFARPWHGVPREAIDWHPAVDEDACIGCGTCVTGCNRLVYRFDYDRKKAVVVDPLNCMIGCVTCMNTCPTHAISFPPLDTVVTLESRADVHHAIEDDLLARREQLAWSETLPDPDRIVSLVVEKIESPNADTRIVTLAPKAEEDCLCQFVAGQYLELFAPDRHWMSRAYSIGNAPHADGRIELQLRRAPGGRFTTWAFESLAVGQVLRARGPLGRFTVRSPLERPLLFIAGGSGIAPVGAMIEQQLALAPERDIALFWGVAHPRDFYQLERIAAWRRSDPALSCTLAAVELAPDFAPPAGCALFHGRVDEAVRKSDRVLASRDAYVAGPPAMMRPVMKALAERGIAREQTYSDAYQG